jgi:hypothetical protein
MHAYNNATQFQTRGTVTARATCGPRESISAYRKRIASREMARIQTPPSSEFGLKSIIYSEFRYDVNRNISAE